MSETFMEHAELTLARVDKWLTDMRQDSQIGKDIQELESWKPAALRRVVLVAVLSWENFCRKGPARRENQGDEREKTE